MPNTAYKFDVIIIHREGTATKVCTNSDMTVFDLKIRFIQALNRDLTTRNKYNLAPVLIDGIEFIYSNVILNNKRKLSAYGIDGMILIGYSFYLPLYYMRIIMDMPTVARKQKYISDDVQR